MTYIPKIYEPSLADWSIDVGLENFGENAIIIPDIVYDTDAHPAIYRDVTWINSQGGTWVPDSAMPDILSADINNYYPLGSEVVFTSGTMPNLVLGTTYYNVVMNSSNEYPYIAFSTIKYQPTIQEDSVGGTCYFWSVSTGSTFIFESQYGGVGYRQWRVKCIDNMYGRTIDYWYPEGGKVNVLDIPQWGYINTMNVFTDLAYPYYYIVLPYDAQDIIDNTMQLCIMNDWGLWWHTPNVTISGNHQTIHSTFEEEPLSPGTEIKNNIGVAAVGVTSNSSNTDIDCCYPRLTRTFPLTGATPSGTIIVQDGWKIDFAQDLMTPSPVASYGVNKDVFNFNDNDDKRKLATRVVVRGKDINGVSISVSLIGIRAYDNNRQFYNGCTYVSRKSEGYIYKNSYNTDLTFDCTAIPGTTVDYTVDFPSSNKTKITVGATGFVLGSQVSFTNPPSPLVNGTVYYITDHTGNYITVAATPGGSAISMKYMTYTLNEAWSISTLPFAGTITVYIHGAYAHAVSVLAGSGRAACLLICTAFGAGYTDADGNIWTCEVDPVYGRITFHAKCENSTSTYLVNFNMGVTFGSAAQYSIGKTIWASTLHASDVAMMEVDNSTGWFTKNMQLQFSATSMPTGLDPAEVYTVGSESIISAAFRFFVNDYSGVVNFTTAGSGVICFKPNSIHNPDEDGDSAIWLYGWNYVIIDGSYLTLSIPGGTSIPFTSVGSPSEIIDINGVMCTTVKIDNWPTIDYGGNRGYLMNNILYVNKKSDVIAGSDLTLRFGEEPIEIDASNCGTDPVYGDYLHVINLTDRITSASKKCYPHGVGCLVMYPDSYDLDNPETDSPVALHGERISDVTVDSNITYGYLDGYATALLLGNGTLYKKATCFGPITKVYVKRVGEMLHNGAEVIQELSRITPPRVGDNIEIVDSYGATPVVWEVMSVTIKYDQGIIELILGDYEMNPITSMIKQTNGINRTLT